jgi:hypothetical protein
MSTDTRIGIGIGIGVLAFMALATLGLLAVWLLS